MNSGEDVVVKLPVKGHIYNVREKKYLGSGDEIRLKLVPAWGYLYAILQNRITGVEIAARIIKECKPYCQGVHIMALGWESKVPALLEAAGI